MTKKNDERATVIAAKENSKSRIISAVIKVMGSLLIFFLAFLFHKKTTEQSEIQNPSTIISKDTSTNNIINQDQINHNEGNVTNEYIFGDKNVNQNDSESKNKRSKPKPEKKQKDKSITNIDKIENNGNLSIGQTGGTVNQTTIINPKSQLRKEIVRLENQEAIEQVSKDPSTYYRYQNTLLRNKFEPKYYKDCKKLFSTLIINNPVYGAEYVEIIVKNFPDELFKDISFMDEIIKTRERPFSDKSFRDKLIRSLEKHLNKNGGVVNNEKQIRFFWHVVNNEEQEIIYNQLKKYFSKEEDRVLLLEYAQK